jgi:hypothetical protein
MKTIKELINDDLSFNEIDVITVNNDGKLTQYDSAESLVYHEGETVVIDYTIEYDADEGMVYLDIIV